ncbi:MAG: 3'-5' exonuclease [Bacteriovorax sp.]|nr:3'-5' exonuclease [Bacteriovorax sp.]
MKDKFSIINIDTTGSNREGQKIIDIALINFDGIKNSTEEIYSTILNPEKNINHNVTLLTGITNLKAMNSPYFYKIAKKIVKLTEGRTIVAYNALFTFGFLQREFKDLGYAYHREIISLDKIAKKLFPDFTSYSTESLNSYFKINPKKTRSALSNAENCLKLFKTLYCKNKKKLISKQDRPQYSL